MVAADDSLSPLQSQLGSKYYTTTFERCVKLINLGIWHQFYCVYCRCAYGDDGGMEEEEEVEDDDECCGCCCVRAFYCSSR